MTIKKGHTTYNGPKTNFTIITLTDGSTIGVEGDETDTVAAALAKKVLVIFYYDNGQITSINPDHIITAIYNQREK